MIINTLRKKMGYKLPRLIGQMINLANRVVPIIPIVEFLPGIMVKLDLTDGNQKWLLWCGIDFEYPFPQIVASWCKKTTAFFDIGSNFGYYSYYVLSLHPTQKIYSFEPNPALYKQQLETKSRNNLNSFMPNNTGIGDTKGVLTLNIDARASGRSTFGPRSELKNKREVQAEIMSFDEWLQNNGIQYPTKPEWVAKIDVEGYEPRVIRGMCQTLNAQAFYALCIEINDYTLNFCGEKKADLYDLLAEYGYHAFDEHLQPTAPQPHNELRNVLFLHSSASPRNS
jgi:FkbM family methyltransferase